MKILKTCTFLLLLFSFVLNSSCKKEITDKIDITNYKWKVQSIKVGNNKTKVPKKDYHNNSISNTDYILSFTNDSIVLMSFSINQGGGNYYIESLGKIRITIGAITEICCDNDFDNKLSLMFSEMKEYSVIDNTLILRGDKSSIELKKE